MESVEVELDSGDLKIMAVASLMLVASQREDNDTFGVLLEELLDMGGVPELLKAVDTLSGAMHGLEDS